jgi:hypothetical protein
VAQEGVELVVAQVSPHEVRVISRTGAGKIEKEKDRYIYTFSGKDPLGQPKSAISKKLTAREWLNVSAKTDFPYAVVRLFEVMQAPGAGEIVVTAQEGYDLASDYELVVGNYKGGHGGLRRDQLVVPFVLAGAGIKKGAKIEVATSEDLGATLFQLMGLKSEGSGQALQEVMNPSDSKSFGAK